MKGFREFAKGWDWRPHDEHRVFEDLIDDLNVPVNYNSQVAYAFVPFCVARISPAFDDQFGRHDAEVEEVMPFVYLVNDRGDALDSGSNVFLPFSQDREALAKVAMGHIRSSRNQLNLLDARAQKRVYEVCQTKAEEDLTDNPGDVATPYAED